MPTPRTDALFANGRKPSADECAGLARILETEANNLEAVREADIRNLSENAAMLEGIIAAALEKRRRCMEAWAELKSALEAELPNHEPIRRLAVVLDDRFNEFLKVKRA